jgi:hypothetical protein
MSTGILLEVEKETASILLANGDFKWIKLTEIMHKIHPKE